MVVAVVRQCNRQRLRRHQYRRIFWKVVEVDLLTANIVCPAPMGGSEAWATSLGKWSSSLRKVRNTKSAPPLQSVPQDAAMTE